MTGSTPLRGRGVCLVTMVVALPMLLLVPGVVGTGPTAVALYTNVDHFMEAVDAVHCQATQLHVADSLARDGRAASSTQPLDMGADISFSSETSGIRLDVQLSLPAGEDQPRDGAGIRVSDGLNGVQRLMLSSGDGIVTDNDFAVELQVTPLTQYHQVYAFGLVLYGNHEVQNERLLVTDCDGLETVLPLPTTRAADGAVPVPGEGEIFLGMVSRRPLVSFRFDESSHDTDTISIGRMVVGTRAAAVMEGVSPGNHAAFWILFHCFVAGMLAVDLLMMRANQVHHGSDMTAGVTFASALKWSCLWILLSIMFAGGVAVYRGSDAAVLWLTSYLLEKFLSVDNLFVFVTIFKSFRTPARFQHTALMWGIVGAIVLRAVFIFTGLVLVEKFGFLMIIFAAFLLYTAYKMWTEDDDDDEEEDHYGHDQARIKLMSTNVVLRAIQRAVPTITEYDEQGRFFVKRPRMGLPTSMDSGAVYDRYADAWHITPLLMVVVIIETTDVIFAMDSIPAILSITHDLFIAYTSNIFAILGLRALYFCLAAAVQKFRHLKYALSFILAFIGVKLLLATVLDFEIGPIASLAVVMLSLIGGIVSSFAL